MRKVNILIIISLLLISCNSEVLPKSKAYLILNYPQNSYKNVTTLCPFNFEISTYATLQIQENCWVKIEYPKLKATIHITYREVHNNLNEILKEVEKLTFEHTIKADAISDRPFENFNEKVFAKLYKVDGNVATNIQFRATDSIKNVLSGALYFNAKPNYDSIMPAIQYLEKDMMHLIETLKWK